MNHSSWLIGTFALLWGLIIYHHLVYPFLLWRLGRTAQPGKRAELCDSLPEITLVIPACNEAETIADKVRNLGMLDYPANRLQVIIACDGCSDETAAVAAAAHREPENRHLQLRILKYDQRSGKTLLLNRVLAHVHSPIVALSDASALISYDALQLAARHFADESLGVLAANYQLFRPGCSGQRHYWQYQRAIRYGECCIGGPIGVSGALWFYRNSLYQPLEPDTINDDFVMPMRMLQSGFKGAFDEEIVALETEQVRPESDLKRRRRIAAGNLQQLIRLRAMLGPVYQGLAFCFASGKALRTLMPWLLAAQLVVTGILASESPLFSGFFYLQLSAGCASVLPLIFSRIRYPAAITSLCYLVNGYLASLLGQLEYLLGMYRKPWQRIH